MLEYNKTYHYFGELGNLSRTIVGCLEAEFKQRPTLKIKVITFPGFADLFNFLYPDNITAISESRYNKFKKNACAGGLIGKETSRLLTNLQKTSVCLAETFNEYDDSIRLHIANPLCARYSPKISKPLAHGTIDNNNIVNIQCRHDKKHPKRLNQTTTDARNIPPDILLDVINKCLLVPGIKVVLHGEPHPDILNVCDTSSRVMFCESLVEGIKYLHRSKLSICNNSGFAQFALNCASNVVVLNNIVHKFPSICPDIIVGNIFQTYTDTIYFKTPTNKYDTKKLDFILKRIFNNE